MLEKKFFFRRAASKKDGLDGANEGAGGWTALVSEPVKIRWKAGKDLTGGLTDAAVAYWDARQRMSGGGIGIAESESKKQEREKELPEYKALVEKIGSSDEGTRSFFSWFGFTATRRYISAEESAIANKAVLEKREMRRRRRETEEMARKKDKNDGEKTMQKEEGDDDDVSDDGNSNPSQDTEIFPDGEELATLLAEEIWPQAIKYFSKQFFLFFLPSMLPIPPLFIEETEKEITNFRFLYYHYNFSSKNPSDPPSTQPKPKK